MESDFERLDAGGRAGELHARFLGVRSADSYGRGRRLRDQCEGVLSSLDTSRTTYNTRTAFHQPHWPSSRRSLIDTHGALIRDTSGTSDLQEERVWAALVLLRGLRDRNFVPSIRSAEGRPRQIGASLCSPSTLDVADPEFREKWKRGFTDGEVACEKLGGAHLLLHGIFAFKVNAEAERTDIIFQDLAGSLADAQRYADGFVLTEWKVARSEKEADKRFAEAKSASRSLCKGGSRRQRIDRVSLSCRCLRRTGETSRRYY
jgi:hypothetical protein